MIPRLHTTLLMALLGASAAGCNGEQAAAPALAVRDSAGIRIVENAARDVPVFDVTGRELYGFDGYPFTRVLTGDIAPDGRVALADIGNDEVVVLSNEGLALHTVGGSGAGPGEFGNPLWVGWLDDGTLAVHDEGNMRASYFQGDELTGTERLPTRVGFGRGLGRSGDTLIVAESGYSPFSSEVWVRSPVWRYVLGSEAADSVLSYDLAMGIDRNAGATPAFRPGGDVASGSGRIVTTRGDRTEVHVFHLDGSPSAIWRWTETRRPIPDELWDLFADARIGDATGEARAESQRQVRASREASDGLLPFTARTYIDDARRVWVGVYPPDGRPEYARDYRVFWPTGEFVTRVRVPPGSVVLDIAEDLLLIAVMDEFEVPTMTLFDISDMPSP